MNNLNSNKINYTLTNRKEFIEWFNKTFIKFRATGKQETIKNKYEPYNYQKLLKNFMSKDSPYRGILLYHGLGTGKTCTSITIAENLKKEKNIIVMLPASLKTNFIHNGLLFCGDEEYKKNEEKYKKKYTFVSYNSAYLLKDLEKIGSLDNKVIIIEEVHNLISIIMSGLEGGGKIGKELYNALMNANNTKIIALSGTPIVNDIFEVGILCNILNGYNEIIYYRIINVPSTFGIKDYNSLEKELLEHKYISYVKVNRMNKSIEFILDVKSYQPEFNEVLEYIDKVGNEKLGIRYLDLKKYSLYPTEEQGDVFRKYFLEEKKTESTLRNEEIFRRRMIGLISYYNSDKGNYPKVIEKGHYRIPMSNYQFQIYEILRAKERSSGRGQSNKKSKKKVKSTFRVFSRQASNFVFPEEINRPYPDKKFIISLKNNKNKNKNELELINKLLEKEEELNNKGTITKDYKKRIEKALGELVLNGEEYFKPGPEGLDKLSPKFKILLENVNKSKGLVFIYSNFRSLEGVELFSKVLDFNGYSSFTSRNNRPKYAIYSGDEDEKVKRKILETFTSDENKTGKLIKIILATLAGAEGLDLKNIRQIHIIEPYWNQMKIKQIIGRGVRRDSHIALPPKERDIEIYRYFSVFSQKNSLITKDKTSTDEHIEEISLKKQKLIDKLLTIFKESAIDCTLNAQNIKGDYRCYNYGRKAQGFSYYPNIIDDFSLLNTVENKKKVQKKLVKAAFYEGKIYMIDLKNHKFYLYSDNKKKKVNIETKKAKPIYIDDEGLVYDKKSIESGNPIMIAKIKNNKLIKI
jgi:superfamily II DNA or RNA helicase